MECATRACCFSFNTHVYVHMCMDVVRQVKRAVKHGSKPSGAWLYLEWPVKIRTYNGSSLMRCSRVSRTPSV